MDGIVLRCVRRLLQLNKDKDIKVVKSIKVKSNKSTKSIKSNKGTKFKQK